MRSMILIALVGVALAASGSRRTDEWRQYEDRRVDEISFKSDREYRYHFDGQLSAGIPIDIAGQHSIKRIQAIVNIQPKDDRTMLMQLTKVRFGASQETQVEPRKIQPFEAFEQTKLEPEHERLLQLPVRFTYRHGMISEIVFDEQDNTWSENVKRAVVNMLQVNILRQGKVETEKRIKDDYVFEENKEQQTWTAIERTLEGECEVTYTQMPLSTGDKQFVKSINFEKCAQRAEQRHYASLCEECEKHLSEERQSTSTMFVNMTVSGDNKYIVNDAEITSQHLFASINDKQKMLVSYVNNRLHLVYSGKVESRIADVQSPTEKQTLLYNNEWEQQVEKFAQTGEEKYLPRNIRENKNKISHITKLLTQLGTQLSKNENAVEPHVPHTFARIVKLLRFCSEEEVERVHQRLMSDSEMNFEKRTLEKVRSMFYNALSIAGTRVTVRLLAQKINKQTIEPTKASLLLKQLVDMRYASPEIVKEILSICESDVASRFPVLSQSCWLTYGAVINGVCGSEEDSSTIRATRDEKMCPRELKKQYIRRIMQQFQSASSRYEKVLALKTLANAGIDMSIYDLQTIIADREETKTVRGQAIEATRRLTRTMPKKIQQILMPVFADITEKPELRMLALRHVLLSEPEMDVLTTIVELWKWREPNQQVRAFTYTSLKSIVDSTSPCKATFSTRVARLFAQMTMDVRPLDSRFASWDAYSQTYTSGWTANWASIFTNESILPNDMLASFDALFAGHLNKHLVQIGFQQHNLDSLLQQLFNKLEETGIDELVVRGKRTSMSMGNPLEMLSNLFNKLRISRRPSSESRREPHGLLYIRHRDVDYAVVPFEKETLPEFIRNIISSGKLDINEIERLLARGEHFSASTAAYVYESMRRIPTALGMPIELSVKMPTLATINGQLKTEMEPRSGDSFEGVRVRLTARPSIATTHVTKIEAHCPVVSVGAKLLANGYVNMPIDTEILVNWHKKLTIKTTTKLPETERRIAHFSTRPVTFVRHHKIDQRQYPEPIERTMLVEEMVMPTHQVERVYFENALGMRMLVSGAIRRPFFPLAAELPKAALIADNHLDIVVMPAENKPAKEINTWMEVEAFQPAGEKMSEMPKFEDFFEGVDRVKSKSHSIKSNKQIDLFDIESYDEEEEKENDETTRRESMKKYAKSYNGQRAYRHRVFFRAEDDNKERYVEAEIKAVCDETTRFCKATVEAKHSPFFYTRSEKNSRRMSKDENKEWSLEGTIQTLYPEQPKNYEQLVSNQAHRELQVDAEFKWGPEGSKKQQLRVRLQGEQSAEAKKWQRNTKQMSQWQTLEQAGRLNQYKAVLDYEMTAECRAYWQRVFSAVSAYQFWQQPFAQTYESNEHGRDGHSKVTLTIEPVMRRLYNLTIETPREVLRSTDMRLPFRAPSTQVYTRYGAKTTSRRVSSVLDVLTKQAECIVRPTGRRIETFDDVIYKAPLTGCYSVLAKDCSSKQPAFAILAKSTGKNTDEKKIMIVTRKANIEIELNKNKEELLVTVDGKRVTEQSELEQYDITMEGLTSVRVENQHFTCKFDGKEIRINLNVIYKNKQCGLCGHYDGETEHEFRPAHNHETEEEEMPKFVKSYLAKEFDGECSSSDEKIVEDETLYGKRYEKKQTGGWKKGHDEIESAEWDDEEYYKQEKKMYKKNTKYTSEEYDDDKEEPIKKTLVKERSSHTCFSVEPQPACRDEQEEKKTEKDTVEFRCVKTNSREEKRIQRILKKESVVPSEELSKLEKTEEYEVRLPTKCSSNMRSRY